MGAETTRNRRGWRRLGANESRVHQHGL